MYGTLAQLARRPLGRMLLLSLALHVALIMLIVPRPFPPVDDVVIAARLAGRPAGAEPAVPRPPVESPRPPAGPAPAGMVLPPAPPATASATPAPAAPAPTSAAPAARLPEADAGLPSVPIPVDIHWYEARQLDVPPRALAAIAPVYPAAARSQGIEGSVLVNLRIDEFGVVREAGVEEGEPPGVFDDSALAALREARFQPGRRDGRPVRAQVRMRLRYVLED
ncbi:MAG: energy transducer TonB [Gallionellaceae bacterium]|nr:energy transducer TonB [Gallionellaceae bacterium]